MTDTAFLAELIAQKAQVATVCTEPAMIAFAAATATRVLGTVPTALTVVTCSGVFKNALGASLPGTARRGPAMAAALGAVIGQPEAKLAILQGIAPEHIEAATRMVDAGCVNASADATREGVYVRVIAQAAGHSADVTIAGGHSQLASVLRDGEPVRANAVSGAGPAANGESPAAPADLSALREWCFGRLVTAATSIDPKATAYLNAGALSNRALSEAVAAARCPVPPAFGTPPLDLRLLPLLAGQDGGALDRRVRTSVAAAVAARMTGQDWPVLTSAGSGNQGITVGVAVVLAAEAVGAPEDRQITALVLAHAVNLYVHAFIGEVSPACGAVSAATGVAVAVCWLLDGSLVQLESAAQLTLASLLGVICDGAKGTCALKCGAAAVEGLLCGQWARSGVAVPAETGIVGRDLVETLTLAKAIVEQGLRQSDDLIIAARTAAR